MLCRYFVICRNNYSPAVYLPVGKCYIDWTVAGMADERTRSVRFFFSSLAVKKQKHGE